MGGKRKNGKGTVVKRSDGRWEGRFIVAYINGKPKLKSVFAHTKSECIKKLKEAKSNTMLTPEKTSPDMLFGNWIDLWYQYFRKPQVRESTQRELENKIYHHIIPGIGNIPLSQLSQKDLQQFYNKEKHGGRLIHTDVFGPGLSDTNIRGMHFTIQASLERARTSNLISVNPAVGCKLPPKKAREMQILSPEELYRFLIQAQVEGYYELFLLELSTGMRRGELLALQWDDLDFDTGELSITKQVGRINGKLVISEPKTKSSIRKIILPDQVVAVLKQKKATSSSRWMFESPIKEGQPLDPTGVRSRFALILEHANCKHIRFHDLRHTFATTALQGGMDVKTLSAVMGHVGSAITLDIYTHITDKMQREAASKIDHRLGSHKSADTDDEPEIESQAHMEYYEPYMGKQRKAGTGCISQINDHLYEGRYSPTWPDGKRHSRNVYAKTRDECEEKLDSLIKQMKAEICAIKLLGESEDRKIPDGMSDKKRAVLLYLGLHPEEKNKSLIARETNVDRSTVHRYYDEFHRTRAETLNTTDN